MAGYGKSIGRASVWIALGVATAIACGGGDEGSNSDAGAGTPDAATAVDATGVADSSVADGGGDDSAVSDASDASTATYGYVRRFPFLRGKGSAKGAVVLRAGDSETAYVTGFSTDGWIGEFPLGNPSAFSYRTLAQSRFKAIATTKSGGIVLAGATRSGQGDAATAPSYPFAMAMNASRALVWQKHLGTGSGTGSAYAVAETPSGDFLVAASANVGAANGFDTRIVRLRSDGSAIWDRTYGAGSASDGGRGLAPGAERPVTILPLEGGSAIVIASTNASFGAGKEDVWAFRIGETGDVVWQKAYGGAKSEIAYGASMSADGTNVYVTGSTDSFGAGAGDLWLLTLDGANGAIRSQLTFGSAEKAEHGRSVTPMDDGGLLVVGTDPDGLLALRLDADLAVTWQRKYRNTAVVDGWAYGTNAIKTADEGFFFLAGGFERGWLIRTAADGTIGGCKAPGFGTPLAADKFLPKVSTGATVDTTVVPQPRTTTAFDLGKALVDVPASTTNACE